MRAKTHNGYPDLIVGHGHACVIAAETGESDAQIREEEMRERLTIGVAQ
jgi:hypothetical protein